MTSNDSGASIYAKNELAKRRYEARVRARRRLCPHLSKAAHSANGANDGSNGIVKSAINSDTKDPTKIPFILDNPRLSKGELCPALAKFELLLWDKVLFYEKCLLEENYFAWRFWRLQDSQNSHDEKNSQVSQDEQNSQNPKEVGENDFPRVQLAAYEKINADDVCVVEDIRVETHGGCFGNFIAQAMLSLGDACANARAQLKVIGRVIDAIYVLENACFKTHESLARLATAISALDNFEQNAVKPILHSFNRGMIYSTPVYERIRRYHRVGYVPAGGIQTMSVEYDCTYKYELKHCDSGILKQIKVLKRHLRECQAWADASTAWLERCISRQDFEPREVLDNFVAPEPIKAHFDFAMSEDERREVIALLAKKRAVIKRADYAKLADDEKERLDKIIVKAKEIQRLITGDFVKDGKFLEAKELINQAAVAPFFE